MAKIALKSYGGQVAPKCDRCGAQTRLFGIEQLPAVEKAELRTFVCMECDAMQADIVPKRR